MVPSWISDFINNNKRFCKIAIIIFLILLVLLYSNSLKKKNTKSIDVRVSVLEERIAELEEMLASYNRIGYEENLPAFCFDTMVPMEVNVNRGVNVRSGPGTGFEVFASLTAGALVEVLAQAEGWYEVKLEDGRTGWIFGGFLSQL